MHLDESCCIVGGEREREREAGRPIFADAVLVKASSVCLIIN